jgi:hypothetical protein
MIADQLREAAGETGYEQLARLIDAVEKPLRTLTGWSRSGNEEVWTKSLSAAAAELAKALVITAENPKLAAVLKKHGRTIINFRKMLNQYAEAPTWEKMSAVLKSQMTKKDNAFYKFIDYKRHVLNVVGGFTTTVESVISVDAFSVSLMTAPQGSDIEWNRDIVEKMRAALTDTKRRLDRFGMGWLAGGRVFAYPTIRLPQAALGSHGAFANYSPTRDTMSIAANSEELLHSVIHELGHRAYFRAIQGRSRTAWLEFWEASQGDPGIEGILKRWEDFAANPPPGMYQVELKGLRYLGHYLGHLRKAGNETDRLWLNLLGDQLGIEEKYDPVTGYPKKNVKPGLDQLIAKKSQARVFLHPVTAYSGTNAEELFAEVFAELGTKGSSRVAPVLKAAFKMVLPQFRESAERGSLAVALFGALD